MTTLQRRAVTTVLALALAAPVTIAPQLAAPSASAAPASEPGSLLFSETFDSLGDALQPRVDDPGIAPGTLGFTHEPPAGWTVENAGFSGGVEEWAGWSFTTRDFWSDADLQQRQWFSAARDIIAVADSDEWADAGAPTGALDTALATPGIDVAGLERVQLEFTSHHRPSEDQISQVLASFDGGQSSVVYDVDVTRSSAREQILIDVPDGAEQLELTWHHHDAYDDWYWAVDDVTVTVALPDADPQETGVLLDVLSDVQGDEAGYMEAMTSLNAMPRQSAASIINGDITADGTEAQVETFLAAAAEVPPASGRLLLNFGNHDAHVGLAQGQERFLEYAGRDTIWGEEVVDGVPVLFVTSDAYLSDDQYAQQLAWLEERLEHYSTSGLPVLVAAHHPLSASVSGTYSPIYASDWDDEAAFTSVLGRYSNAVLFTSHTHWDVGLDDWYARVSFAGGDPRGIPVFNTGSIQTLWGSDGDESSTGERTFGVQHEQGLRVEVLDDRVRVEAHDIDTGEVVQTVEIPITTPAP